MKKIVVLHGPNLNLLGTREPDLYGSMSLDAINQELIQHAQSASVELKCFQSNSESELIQAIHDAKTQSVAYIIINPAAFTHTSIALRDALSAVGIPFIEVHLTNIFSREPFRQHSYFSDIAKGCICGLGSKGYLLAFNYILTEL